MAFIQMYIRSAQVSIVCNYCVDCFVCCSDSTSSKVQSYMLDSMVSVIQYGENIPAELLDILLSSITPAQKVE